MASINWTKEQLQVVNSIYNNTLVSASAGSGKTAVMLERVMRLVTGENGEKKIPIKRIVMVTFNESVACELKSKISAKLSDKIQERPEDGKYLREQIEDVPLCDISTMHSFCSNVIKNNFEFLGVQPSFSIVDDSEKDIIFGKAISNVLKQYKENYDYSVDILINYFGGESRFCETLSKLYGFLEAQLDRDKYLDEVAFSCYGDDFKLCALAKNFLAETHSRCVDLIDEGQSKEAYFKSAHMDKRREHVEFTLLLLNKIFNTRTLEELAETVRFAPDIARLPSSKKNDDADKEIGNDYKAYNDSVKDFFKSLKGVFTLSYDDAQLDIARNKKYLVSLVDMLRQVYQEYSALKKKDNKMDFADLEYYAVKAVQNDDIAKELSDSYDYICVDEYQDINAVQEYILTRLSNGKNMFMVGDVKQSIYQFRLTDPQIFLSKYREYQRKPNCGNAFSLNRNYRSEKGVIDFVNAVFDEIMRSDLGGIDYRSESRLIKGSESCDEIDARPVRIAYFAKETKELSAPIGEDGVYSVRDSAKDEEKECVQEADYIISQIRNLVGKAEIPEPSEDGKKTNRTVKYSDIVLLCSKRSESVEKIVGALKSAGIPVDGGRIVKEKPNSCVSLFCSFIRILDNYRQDIPLTDILTCGVFAPFGYKDMADIKAAYRKEKFFHEAVEKYANEKNDGIAQNLQEFFAMLDKYRRVASFVSVSRLINILIADFNYRAYMTCFEGGERELAGLDGFISSLEQKSYDRGLSKFVEALDNAPDFGKVSGEIGNEGDCVSTDTIHRSKGLEYPIVFLIDSGKQINFTDLNTQNVIYDKSYGVAIKSINEQDRFYDDSLPFKLMRRAKVKDLTEEFMRLFYVATTRAKYMLFVTATGGLKKDFGETSVKNPKSMIDWLNNVAVANENFAKKYIDASSREESDGKTESGASFKRKYLYSQNANAFLQELDCNYPFDSSTTLPLKHTVTSVNNAYYEKIYRNDDLTSWDTDVIDSIKDGDIFGDEPLDKRGYADEGVAYHRVLECIDYDCYTKDDVQAQITKMIEDGLLSEEQAKFVDSQSVLECLCSPIMQEARNYPHYREKQFMLDLPACEFLDTDSNDRVLLQGTVDLFIQGKERGGENILVDFKFSRKSKQDVKKRYEKQLELYAKAVEECLGIKVDKKVIFMLEKNQTIIY